MLEMEQVKPELAAPEMAAFKADPLPRTIPRQVSARPVHAPLRVVWREIRFRLLPLAAFLIAGVCAVLLWREWIIVEQSALPASSIAQDPGIIEPKAAIAGHEPATVAPLESAAARD